MTLVKKVNSGYCKLKGEKTTKKKETDGIKKKKYSIRSRRKNSELLYDWSIILDQLN